MSKTSAISERDQLLQKHWSGTSPRSSNHFHYCQNTPSAWYTHLQINSTKGVMRHDLRCPVIPRSPSAPAQEKVLVNNPSSPVWSNPYLVCSSFEMELLQALDLRWNPLGRDSVKTSRRRGEGQGCKERNPARWRRAILGYRCHVCLYGLVGLASEGLAGGKNQVNLQLWTVPPNGLPKATLVFLAVS